MDIPALRVVSSDDIAIPSTSPDGQNLPAKSPVSPFSALASENKILHSHLVAVEMPRVACWAQIIDDNPDCSIAANIEYIPFGIKRIRVIARLCQEQEWIVVIAAEGGVVDSPNKVTSSIDGNVHGHVYHSAGITGGNGIRRDRSGKGVIGAWIGSVNLGDRVGWR